MIAAAVPSSAYISISVAAMVIALVTLVGTLRSNKNQATNSYVEQLEKRVSDGEDQVRTLKARVADLETENLALMRKLLAAS